jgi:hypothetical protein
MMRVSPAASVPRNRQTTDSKLAFFLPLVGYWLLAIVMVFHPRPPWVLVILGSPLVLLALAISGHLNERRAEPPHPTVTVDHATRGRGGTWARRGPPSKNGGPGMRRSPLGG